MSSNGVVSTWAQDYETQEDNCVSVTSYYTILSIQTESITSKLFELVGRLDMEADSIKDDYACIVGLMTTAGLSTTITLNV